MLDYLSVVNAAEPQPAEIVPDDPPALIQASNPLDLAPIKAGLSKYNAPIANMEAQAKALVVDDDASLTMATQMGSLAHNTIKAIEKARLDAVAPAHEFKSTVDRLAKAYKDRFEAIKKACETKITAYQKAKALERAKAEEAARRAAAEAQARIDAEVAAENAKRRAEAEAADKAAREAREAADRAAREAEAASDSKARDAAAAKAREAEAEALAAQEAARVTAQAPEIAPIVIATPVIPDEPRIVRTEAGSSHQARKWTFIVVDPAQVPRDYLMVDEKAIRRAIKDGVREIAGVEIFEDTQTRFGK